MKTRIFLLAVVAALWTTAVGQTKTIIEQQCWLDGNLSAAQPASATPDEWDCVLCGAKNKGKFCMNCGAPKH